MSKRCCVYHDRLPEEFIPGAEPDAFADGCECGLAGMGIPTVCCEKCPQTNWFVNHRGIPKDNLLYAIKECAPKEQQEEDGDGRNAH